MNLKGSGQKKISKWYKFNVHLSNPQKFNCTENTHCEILKSVRARIGDEAVAGIITAMIQYCTVRSPVQ